MTSIIRVSLIFVLLLEFGITQQFYPENTAQWTRHYPRSVETTQYSQWTDDSSYPQHKSNSRQTAQNKPIISTYSASSPRRENNVKIEANLDYHPTNSPRRAGNTEQADNFDYRSLLDNKIPLRTANNDYTTQEKQDLFYPDANNKPKSHKSEDFTSSSTLDNSYKIRMTVNDSPNRHGNDSPQNGQDHIYSSDVVSRRKSLGNEGYASSRRTDKIHKLPVTDSYSSLNGPKNIHDISESPSTNHNVRSQQSEVLISSAETSNTHRPHVTDKYSPQINNKQKSGDSSAFNPSTGIESKHKQQVQDDLYASSGTENSFKVQPSSRDSSELRFREDKGFYPQWTNNDSRFPHRVGKMQSEWAEDKSRSPPGLDDGADRRDSINFDHVSSDKDLTTQGIKHIYKAPIYAPDKCPEDQLLYPAEKETDSICDCGPGDLYDPETDQCYGAYKQGPCRSGEYFILNKNKHVPECERNPCPDGSVRYQKRCYELGMVEGPCPPINEGGGIFGVNKTTLEVGCLTGIEELSLFKVPANCPPGSKRDSAHRCRENFNV